MKQFSLRQVLPIPFRMPFERVDKVRKACYDYSKSFKELIAVWDVRQNMVLNAKTMKLSLFRCVTWSTSESSWNILMQEGGTTTIVCHRTRGWSRWNVENVPLPKTSHDCDIFVIGFVEHTTLNCMVEFTRWDMMYYYRWKLVVHQYNRQNCIGEGFNNQHEYRRWILNLWPIFIILGLWYVTLLTMGCLTLPDGCILDVGKVFNVEAIMGGLILLMYVIGIWLLFPIADGLI